eukprot:COSAG06_NODE_11997_length_1437_cov_2.572496_1_plen_121_part_00
MTSGWPIFAALVCVLLAAKLSHYWAAPAAARDHVAALDMPPTVCVPVRSARIARGGAQQQGDHDASITPIAGCQSEFGLQVNGGLDRLPRGEGLSCPHIAWNTNAADACHSGSSTSAAEP